MTMVSRARSLVTAAGLTGAAGLALLGGGAASAVHEDVEFPVAIHAGTCEAPGDEVVALDALVRLPQGSGEENRAGAPGAQVVHGSPEDASIDLTIDDLFAANHILAVFNPEGDIVACGPIGAYSYEDGDDLYIGLRSQGESPYSGVAIFEGEDDDEEESDGIDVDIYLVNNTPAPAASPEATPAG